MSSDTSCGLSAPSPSDPGQCHRTPEYDDGQSCAVQGQPLCSQVRPRFGAPDHAALWLIERWGRLQPREINDRFTVYRNAIGLPPELTPHSLRHSHVTHRIAESPPGTPQRRPAGPTPGASARHRLP